MDTNDQTKTLKETTDTNPQVELVDAEPITVAMEDTPAPTAGAAIQKRSNKYTIVTILLVAAALLVVVFQLERQDRIGTNIFGPMIAALEANAPVATVNGQDILAADLESGVTQLTQAAVQQGFDITDPEVQAEIQNQAIEMMINTTLLEQAAVANNITVEDDAINARVAELATAAGGQEALLERLAEFDIDEVRLRSDVTDELTIRALLETVLSGDTVTATEAEITAIYDNAVAASNGQPLPPLSEVSGQIEQQIRQTKEQEAVEAYLQGLRADADIVTN